MSIAPQLSKSATHRSPEMISPLLRVSLLLGVALHLAGFLIFRVVSSPLPDRVATGPYVEYVSAGSLANDRELEELAALFDSAPLFIPTRWNASQVLLVDSKDKMQGQFPEFEPEIQLLTELQPSSFLVPQNIAVDKPLIYWRRAFGASSQALLNPRGRSRNSPMSRRSRKFRLWGNWTRDACQSQWI